MIYEPLHRAQELRHRVFESMSAEEIEEYAKTHPPVENRPAGEESPDPDEEQLS